MVADRWLHPGDRSIQKGTGPEYSAVVDVEQASDANLVVAVGRWQQQALAEIYRRHGGAVHSLARRIIRNDPPAEEITQEIFLDLWNQPGQIRSPAGHPPLLSLARTHGKSVDFVRSEVARRETGGAHHPRDGHVGV